MKNKSDEKVVDFYFILYFMEHTKIEKSLSFFDLPDHLKHDSENHEYIHFIEEDGKPIIKLTIKYTKNENDCTNFPGYMNQKLGYGFKGSKRLGGGFIMYDLEHQEEALDYLEKSLIKVVYNKDLNYALIGITENSKEKDLTKEKEIEDEFCKKNNLIFTGYAYYSFDKKQRWEFIKDCIKKIAGDEIEEIKEERKREKEKRKREEEERKREEEEIKREEEERKREEEERKRDEEEVRRKRKEIGFEESEHEDSEDFEIIEEGLDLENGGCCGCK